MQKINLKKTTKEQMLTMLEAAWQENAGANEEIAALRKRIEDQNDALAECLAEKNELRDQLRGATETEESFRAQRDIAAAERDCLHTKLADTEAALRRANSEAAVLRHDLTCEREVSAHFASVCKWLSDHPWRNLWAWFKLLFS